MTKHKMLLQKKAVFFIIALMCAAVYAVHNALRWPVDLPASLTGTFGEQRGKYLHSGIDIKTEGRVGHSVYAIEDGYLHSITSRDIGYGNSIILHHGNFLSQYAHLDSFVEGSHMLNSLVAVIKLLYENDVENFIFKKMRIHFKKGELIAQSGETGAGPPHLHFAIRESTGPVNPLEFFSIDDDEAPVIRAITFCIEKEGSTVYSETVAVHKRLFGFAPNKKVFKAPPQARCFVKLSCFDRVKARSRCAVYKIILFEENNPIFEIDFARFRWAESAMAQFIFDSSIPSFGGESLYTYFLCQREGNAFSRIRSRDGGYFTAGSEKKRFTIKVTDFAGNESAVEFFLEKDDSFKIESDYVLISSRKKTVIADSQGNFTIEYPRNALRKDAYVKIIDSKQHSIIEKLVSSNIIQKGDVVTIYSVYPFDQLLMQNARIEIKRPEWISKEEANNILIYRSFDETMPAGLLTRYNSAKDCFEAETSGHGHFYLLRDRKSPIIFLPPFQDCVTDKGPERILRLYLTDDLSGINSKSIKVYVDGTLYPSFYDNDRSWIEVKLPKKEISKEIHHLFVRVKDRANNVGCFRSIFAF